MIVGYTVSEVAFLITNYTGTYTPQPKRELCKHYQPILNAIEGHRYEPWQHLSCLCDMVLSFVPVFEPHWHLRHMVPPQNRQWWRARKKLSVLPQMWQVSCTWNLTLREGLGGILTGLIFLCKYCWLHRFIARHIFPRRREISPNVLRHAFSSPWQIWHVFNLGW